VQHYIEMAPWVQPLLLFNLALLALLGERLRRLPSGSARALVVLLAAASAALLTDFCALAAVRRRGLAAPDESGAARRDGGRRSCCPTCLAVRALSPALTEARLQSLTPASGRISCSTASMQ
jgi:hypothetical protein